MTTLAHTLEISDFEEAARPARDQTDTATALERKLQTAAAVFSQYSQISLAQRSERLLAAANVLEAQSERWALLMTMEMGKPLTAARAEALKCAAVCRYYAEHGASMLADEPLHREGMRSMIRYQPLGPLLAIMPWNFPFWQVIRFAAPALFAGNTILLKHAPNVPGCSLAIERIFAQAGFEPGVLQSVFADTPEIAEIIRDERVRGVTLTGSEAAGMSVAAVAGGALKKVVLELGGSDPFIIMPSANLPEAVKNAVGSRMLNNGQSCIAAKRLLVHEGVYERVLPYLVQAVSALRVGSPFEESTDIGPLALERFAVHLQEQVNLALDAGARVLCGGKRSALGAAYFEPTVLADLPRDASIGREEFFGPVLLVYRVANAADALELANDSPFGLGASVWTRDTAEQEWFAEHLQVGQVTINAMTISDPRVPFGGTKRSGLGRELGVYGVREFTNVKAINFALPEKTDE